MISSFRCSAPAAALIVAAVLSLLASGLARSQQGLVPAPSLVQRVTDLTGTLSARQRDALEASLAELETRKGSQVAVLLVATTLPEEIEQYSIRVADAWKVGRGSVDDGVIVVVAKDDRRMRIEVGRGLEGAIPDAYAKRIVSDIMAPRFRQGDFYGGLREATEALERLISGEEFPAPTGGRPGDGTGWAGLFIILLIGTVVIGRILTSIFGRFPGSAATGGIVGGIVWMSLAALALAFGAGLLAFLFSLFQGGPHGGYTGGTRGPVVFGPRGGYRRGPFGGGWSSGGWSGGGGSFGGGGASGSW